MQSILNGFLKSNLLNIGEDDSKLALLEAAATDLTAQIKETPILAQRFALAGLADNLPSTDPIYVMVDTAVTSKWATIANKIGPNPVQVYRAVALRALQLAGSDDAHLRYAVALVAEGMGGLDKKSQAHAPIAAMLEEFAKVTIDEVSAVWVNPVDMAFPKLSAKIRKVAGLKEDLSVNLFRAVGPTDKSGKAQTDPNPHWPNSHQAWALEFAQRATDAIYSAVQSGAKGYSDDMTEAIKEILQSWTDSLEKLAVRDAKSELLWLKMSQYSPSAAAGFRSLSADGLILHAAIDVSRTVPGMAPISVEYFLRELVAPLSPKSLNVRDALSAFSAKLQGLAEGKSLIEQEVLPPTGRRSLIDFATRPGSDSFESQTGLADNAELPGAELALLLYRDLQVRKLLSSAS